MSTSMQNPSVRLILKLFLIGGLALVLWVPTLMVMILVQERADRRDQVKAEVAATWGAEQTLIGPVVTVPFHERTAGESGTEALRYAHFLPDSLNVRGTLKPEIRNRSIYEVVVYTTELTVTGVFARPSFEGWGVADEDVVWDRATIAIGVGDLRGLAELPELVWGGRTLKLEAGSGSRTISPGLEASLGPNGFVCKTTPQGPTLFSAVISLRGTGELEVVPTGRETRVELQSTWPNPSFNGAFLPEERELGDDGFRASWRVLQANRSLAQRWRDDGGMDHSAVRCLRQEAFGVRLLPTVDGYQKTTRSLKYSVLFTLLTFVAVFVVEHGGRESVHPVQYLVVGLALVVFYLVLLAVSELVAFGPAFLIASATIVAMVTAYARALFHHKGLALVVGGVLTGVYGALFAMLGLEDLALLMGTALLLAVLGVVMVLTRRLNRPQ